MAGLDPAISQVSVRSPGQARWWRPV